MSHDPATPGDSKPPGGDWVELAMCMAARTGIWGYYRSGRQLLETIA